MTWEYTTLGEVAEILRGVTYKKDQASDSTFPGAIPLLRATNIGSGLNLREGLVYVPEDQVRAHQILVKGDIVLASSSGSLNVVGKSARLTEDWRGTFGAFCATIRPNQLVDSRFLAFFLQSPKLRARWSEAARGTNINNLKRDDLTSTPLPLPPLEEQRRIVTILEDHLSRLDAADELLEHSARRAEALWWKAATEQLSRVQGEETRLGEIGALKNGIYVSRPGVAPNGAPILRIGAVRPMTLDLEDLRYTGMAEQAVEKLDGRASPGDLLFTRYNGNAEYVGACAVVPGSAPFLTYPDKLIRLRIENRNALPEYVALACSSGETRAQIRQARRTSAGQVGIAGRSLKQISFHLPDIDTQRRIISETREIRQEASRLNDVLQRALRRSASLRRSLLSAAFSGRLTGSSPEMSAVSEMIGA
ncbi:restriction endonuclease subunit S [Gulosibacter molinativorax]|uniref:Type I restriction modification DNA specificity domain-containing protein n=1 Tax=Gulosibacter molinativorax TaxID=256821 RepID=A0ABT7CBC0_9MICO|nr:restriction endonuclease subunit S [Gulosibacter molinativorax]MDJ1372439.1 hypothetical protein [Gulosibacter molinativorax]QUY61212.1 Type I restriction-modification system, specificity subunit S [Gulosibacter molinativorax]